MVISSAAFILFEVEVMEIAPDTHFRVMEVCPRTTSRFPTQFLRWARGTGWTWPGRWRGWRRGPPPSSPALSCSAISMVCQAPPSSRPPWCWCCQVSAWWRQRMGRCPEWGDNYFNIVLLIIHKFRCDCHHPVGDSTSTRCHRICSLIFVLMILILTCQWWWCVIDKITLILLLINFYYGISMLKSGNISHLMLS